MSETRVLLANIDEPDLHTIEVYERLGGYGSLRKALLEMTPEAVLHGSRSRDCAAVAAQASRWARRRASSPRAPWTSTCAATRTSPSPARSRTAC